MRRSPGTVALAALVILAAACGGSRVSEVPSSEATSSTASVETGGPDHLGLEPPGGPHPVGTEVHHWTDGSRPEPGTDDPEDRRQLIVQLWYPAAGADDGTPYPFFPDLAAFQATFGSEAYPDSLGEVSSHSRLGSAPAAAEQPWPVVVFFHGWRSRRTASTGLMEALASHGFVAVGVDQPFAGRIALPDGSVTESRDDFFSGPQEMLAFYAGDYRLVVERLAALTPAESPLAGRLALEHLGVMGHSNGGITAAQASHVDPRVAAVALLDSFSSDVEFLYRLRRPLLLARTGGAEAPSDDYWAGLSSPVYELELTGGGHLTATDLPYVQAAGEDERRQAAAAAQALDTMAVSFFSGQLRDAAGELEAPPTTPPVSAVLRRHEPVP